ncbi:uncharacterized protein LOC21399898 isoform X2 [Morus notabilis]|nr:uncharacterized protein LOC21399898 isoform X2 [Morus notabilis]
MCPKGGDKFHGGCKRIELIAEDETIMDHSCPQILPEGSSKNSSISSTPNRVYKRRKLQGNSISSLPRQGQGSTRRSGQSFSIVSANTPSVTTKEQNVALPVDRAPKTSVQKTLEVDSLNDSCSSSKSNAEQVSSSIKMDETSECSSSSAVVMEYMGDDLSEKEFCIRILRSHGLLERDFSTRSCASSEVIGVDNGDRHNYCRSCKICARSEITIKLLICDHCEEAFHLSCCNPRLKKAPLDEWFCHSCMKKREQILKDNVRRKLPYVTSELSGYKSLSSKGKTSPLALMLRDIEPRTTRVRIGKDFQAEVPEWSGPIDNDDDGIGESVELDPSQFSSLLESKPNNYKFSSVHNWLQCRAVLDGSLDGANETICGKWRRAPLFEVQTDDWECYCSVLWDSRYADCAVPQEMETDKVLEQLKDFEKLRPRLWERRKISDHTKSNGNTRNPT